MKWYIWVLALGGVAYFLNANAPRKSSRSGASVQPNGNFLERLIINPPSNLEQNEEQTMTKQSGIEFTNYRSILGGGGV